MASVHPSDRQLVDTWSNEVRGRVLDAGCGPGHWTAYLAGRGLDVYGVDVVPAFLEHARATCPDVRFDLQSIDRLDAPDGSLGGILSWFSTIHHEPSAISTPVAEFARVLRPGGRLVLGYFDGDVCEPFEHAVARAYRWPAHDLHRVLEDAGLDVLETQRRTTRGERPVGAIVCARRGRPGSTEVEGRMAP